MASDDWKDKRALGNRGKQVTESGCGHAAGGAREATFLLR